MLVPNQNLLFALPTELKRILLKQNIQLRFKNPDKIKILPWDMVEIEEGPAGLMLIHRIVFEKLIDKHPELSKVEFEDSAKEKMNKATLELRKMPSDDICIIFGTQHSASRQVNGRERIYLFVNAQEKQDLDSMRI